MANRLQKASITNIRNISTAHSKIIKKGLQTPNTSQIRFVHLSRKLHRSKKGGTDDFESNSLLPVWGDQIRTALRLAALKKPKKLKEPCDGPTPYETPKIWNQNVSDDHSYQQDLNCSTEKRKLDSPKKLPTQDSIIGKKLKSKRRSKSKVFDECHYKTSQLYKYTNQELEKSSDQAAEKGNENSLIKAEVSLLDYKLPTENSIKEIPISKETSKNNSSTLDYLKEPTMVDQPVKQIEPTNITSRTMKGGTDSEQSLKEDKIKLEYPVCLITETDKFESDYKFKNQNEKNESTNSADEESVEKLLKYLSHSDDYVPQSKEEISKQISGYKQNYPENKDSKDFPSISTINKINEDEDRNGKMSQGKMHADSMGDYKKKYEQFSSLPLPGDIDKPKEIAAKLGEANYIQQDKLLPKAFGIGLTKSEKVETKANHIEYSHDKTDQSQIQQNEDNAIEAERLWQYLPEKSKPSILQELKYLAASNTEASTAGALSNSTKYENKPSLAEAASIKLIASDAESKKYLLLDKVNDSGIELKRGHVEQKVCDEQICDLSSHGHSVVNNSKVESDASFVTQDQYFDAKEYLNEENFEKNGADQVDKLCERAYSSFEAKNIFRDTMNEDSKLEGERNNSKSVGSINNLNSSIREEKTISNVISKEVHNNTGKVQTNHEKEPLVEATSTKVIANDIESQKYPVPHLYRLEDAGTEQRTVHMEPTVIKDELISESLSNCHPTNNLKDETSTSLLSQDQFFDAKEYVFEEDFCSTQLLPKNYNKGSIKDFKEKNTESQLSMGTTKEKGYDPKSLVGEETVSNVIGEAKVVSTLDVNNSKVAAEWETYNYGKDHISMPLPNEVNLQSIGKKSDSSKAIFAIRKSDDLKVKDNMSLTKRENIPLVETTSAKVIANDVVNKKYSLADSYKSNDAGTEQERDYVEPKVCDEEICDPSSYGHPINNMIKAKSKSSFLSQDQFFDAKENLNQVKFVTNQLSLPKNDDKESFNSLTEGGSNSILTIDETKKVSSEILDNSPSISSFSIKTHLKNPNRAGKADKLSSECSFETKKIFNYNRDEDSTLQIEEKDSKIVDSINHNPDSDIREEKAIYNEIVDAKDDVTLEVNDIKVATEWEPSNYDNNMPKSMSMPKEINLSSNEKNSDISKMQFESDDSKILKTKPLFSEPEIKFKQNKNDVQDLIKTCRENIETTNSLMKKNNTNNDTTVATSKVSMAIIPKLEMSSPLAPMKSSNYGASFADLPQYQDSGAMRMNDANSKHAFMMIHTDDKKVAAVTSKIEESLWNKMISNFKNLLKTNGHMLKRQKALLAMELKNLQMTAINSLTSIRKDLLALLKDKPQVFNDKTEELLRTLSEMEEIMQDENLTKELVEAGSNKRQIEIGMDINKALQELSNQTEQFLKRIKQNEESEAEGMMNEDEAEPKAEVRAYMAEAQLEEFKPVAMLEPKPKPDITQELIEKKAPFKAIYSSETSESLRPNLVLQEESSSHSHPALCVFLCLLPYLFLSLMFASEFMESMAVGMKLPYNALFFGLFNIVTLSS